MSESYDLACLAATTPMSDARRMEFYALAARVRRLELFADEVVSNAQEDAMLMEQSPNVVHVEFRR